VDASLTARSQDIQEELPLQERLAAGERDTSARLVVEDLVLLNLRYDLLDGVPTPNELAGLRRA